MQASILFSKTIDSGVGVKEKKKKYSYGNGEKQKVEKIQLHIFQEKKKEIFQKRGSETRILIFEVRRGCISQKSSTSSPPLGGVSSNVSSPGRRRKEGRKERRHAPRERKLTPPTRPGGDRAPPSATDA